MTKKHVVETTNFVSETLIFLPGAPNFLPGTQKIALPGKGHFIPGRQVFRRVARGKKNTELGNSGQGNTDNIK